MENMTPKFRPVRKKRDVVDFGDDLKADVHTVLPPHAPKVHHAAAPIPKGFRKLTPIGAHRSKQRFGL